MEHERPDIEVLTDYFTELYRSDESLYRSARNLFGDFMQYQVIPSDTLDANDLITALDNNDRDYEWDEFEREFQVFLEKRLDRHHDGSIKNTDIPENDFKVERHYNLGYISTDFGSPEPEKVFMTSVIQFEDPEEDDYAIEVEYLGEEEGLEAVRHLLEKDDREKVSDLIRFGLKINSDRALKAYKVVAREDPVLANNLLDDLEIYDEDLESSMKAIYFKNNPDVFESFSNELDF